MPPVNIRLAAACVLLVLAATGCGSNGEPSSAKSSSPSASGSASHHGLRPARQADAGAAGPRAAGQPVQRGHAQADGGGDQLDPGPLLPRRRAGRGHLPGARHLERQEATARLAIVGKDAFLQVDQWKKPSRGCWLKTTSQELSQRFALDVADSDEVPLPVGLLTAFVPESSQGQGLIQGHLDIAEALPLLSGSLKSQLTQARPSGTVAAFLTYDPRHMLITVPGYALSNALSTSLKVDEQKLSEHRRRPLRGRRDDAQGRVRPGGRPAAGEADEHRRPRGQPLRMMPLTRPVIVG